MLEDVLNAEALNIFLTNVQKNKRNIVVITLIYMTIATYGKIQWIDFKALDGPNNNDNL